jgi:formylglycine-generating enzyme required for sulfatase activity
MAAPPRRLPGWLLIALTGILAATALELEGARPFPLWRLALQWTPSALPSARAVPADELQKGLPTVSLVLDEPDLYDKGTGILANKLAHGPDWERPASIAYFERGRLLFASGVGVRIHGGGSRITSRRQGFRVYFRRRYGAREFAPGLVFDADAQPIRRLVVHNDVRRDADGSSWHLVNPLAYDIAAAMGAITPDTKPVRFFLNGEYYGVFVLTERFDEFFFAAHWGHEDVVADQPSFDTLFEWVTHTRPLTMEAVGRQVDLESLTRWFLAVAFCATRDAYQGPGQYADLTRQASRWFWVNWDMDLSFRDWNLDSYQYLLDPIAEERRGRNRAEPRAILVSNLIAEDAAYRDFFKRTFQQVMNHRVTEDFLAARTAHYAEAARRLGVEHQQYLPRVKEFLARRPAFFRHLTEQWLNTPPSQPLTILAPAEVAIVVDGERVAAGYRGLYFPDLEVSIEVPAEHRTGFSGWRVNGRRLGGEGTLAISVNGPTQVEALYGQPGPAPDVVAPAAAALRPLASTASPTVWRRIPRGSYSMGCVPGDALCEGAEQPRHKESVPEPFDMMDREVSARDFEAFATATHRQMPRQPDWFAAPTHPVVNITWDEAHAYCEWAGGQLPTEVEWEYAARGGLDGQPYPWGNEPPETAANARLITGRDRWLMSAPVASFAPNGWGLHDMSGNVWEWTASTWRPAHDAAAMDGEYELKTIKGGSWDSAPPRLRLSARTALSRRGRHNLYVGFRCLRTPPLSDVAAPRR